MKKNRHYISQEMLSLLDNKDYGLTINIVGAGGTGSNVVVALAKVSLALHSLGKTMPLVRVYDSDLVSEGNIGRMAETYSYDIGRRKSDVLVERINRSYGFSWLSRGNYPQDVDSPANITLSCVDTLKSRKAIIAHLKKYKTASIHTWMRPYYMIDSGNSLDTLQIILSTVRTIPQPTSSKYKTVSTLPNLFQLYKNIKEDKSVPSCSLRDALSKQNLFINQYAATFVCDMLWKMLTCYYIDYSQLYFNGENMELTHTCENNLQT